MIDNDDLAGLGAHILVFGGLGGGTTAATYWAIALLPSLWSFLLFGAAAAGAAGFAVAMRNAMRRAG